MNIVMSGLDHSIAGVESREKSALTREEQILAYEKAAENADILGAVILSTCNRTEIYLSLAPDTDFEPFSLISGESMEHYTKKGRECFFHLAEMACGVHSRIFGEDQILAQVKKAIAFSRECGAADNTLEVFFRDAVTAAKKVKTQLDFSREGGGAAAAALEVLRAYTGVKNTLVIGNGEVGRLTAQTLRDAGYYVTMTLRQYRHSQVRIPSGVAVIDYDERYERMDGFDAVVSATTSPHWTVEAMRLYGLERLPRVFVDLAMPRDIEPDVAELPGVDVYDIDAAADKLGRSHARDCPEGMVPIIEEAYAALLKWADGRERFLSGPVKTHFPLFVECTGQRVLVVGGGPIAARRVGTLSKFDFSIDVVAPEARDEILRLAEAGRINYIKRKFEDDDAEGAFFIVAATNDREANHHIGVVARHLGIYCSVADRRDECTFFFPALAETDSITVGVCGSGRSHRSVAEAAKKIREVLYEEKTDNRQP